MEGIGDIINPVILPPMWYVIVYPNVSISTKAVYESLRIVLTKEHNDIKLMGNFSNPGEIAGILENDLEEVAVKMCPQIAKHQGYTERYQSPRFADERKRFIGVRCLRK